ncbi:MAG: hypothetical protein HONBIEJF_02063 [Fimbriimonadaceae bacterium]|nr:hypothetical protein [Fimbriimonadaceae bacterium]
MKVLVVNRDMTVGGGVTYILKLAAAMNPLGVETHLIAAGGASEPALREVCASVSRTPILHPIQAPWLAARIRALRPDVVVAHAYTQAKVAAVACGWTKTPLVITMHGFIGGRRVGQFKKLFLKARRVVVMNENLMRVYTIDQDVADRFVMSRLPVTWPANARHEPRKAQVFGYCSRLSTRKAPRCEAWLHAIARIRPARAVVIGDGDEAPRLRRVAEDLGIGVEWWGEVPNASARFVELDVVAGAGYVAVEAIAAGAAVVGLGFEGCFGAVTTATLSDAMAWNYGDQSPEPLPDDAATVERELRKAAAALESGAAAEVAKLCELEYRDEIVARKMVEIYSG